MLVDVLVKARDEAALDAALAHAADKDQGLGITIAAVKRLGFVYTVRPKIDRETGAVIDHGEQSDKFHANLRFKSYADARAFVQANASLMDYPDARNINTLRSVWSGGMQVLLPNGDLQFRPDPATYVNTVPAIGTAEHISSIIKKRRRLRHNKGLSNGV